jgi:phospholipid/cholesterol/gamma-HCH transport system ATP-binding protein
VIRLEGVSVGFDDRDVLSDVSLHLESGALVALIGPPSAGKSLLLKILAGLVRPRAGKVLIGEVDLMRATPSALSLVQKHIGMLFQNNALFDSKSIFDNVAFPLRRSAEPVSEEEIAERVRARLAEVGLAGAAALLPHALSGGMQKRAGIARATIASPRLRLFDEPTAGLDPVTSARILRLITGLHAQAAGQAVTIIVSNEMDTLLKAAPRTIMLHQGRVAFDGATADLQSAAAPEVARAFATGDVSFAI